jgi:hypothetical protein
MEIADPHPAYDHFDPKKSINKINGKQTGDVSFFPMFPSFRFREDIAKSQGSWMFGILTD